MYSATSTERVISCRGQKDPAVEIIRGRDPIEAAKLVLTREADRDRARQLRKRAEPTIWPKP
jgi:hypothetical protein